jgi:hypothetical protein
MTHQDADVADPPLDPVRMAWPFKTEEERRLIREWQKKRQKVAKEEFLNNYEEALL